MEYEEKGIDTIIWNAVILIAIGIVITMIGYIYFEYNGAKISCEDMDGEFENSKNKIEQKMAIKETYEQGAFVVSLQKEYADVIKNLQNCYSTWEKAQLELEEILKNLNDELN